MELAIPLIALGGMYVVSNQKKYPFHFKFFQTHRNNFIRFNIKHYYSTNFLVMKLLQGKKIFIEKKVKKWRKFSSKKKKF